MTVTRDHLLDALELGSLALPLSSGKTWRLDVPGVVARASTLSSPLINLVAMARLAPADADASIARIADHFRAAGQVFGWMVGPRSTPADLGERLEAAGLVVFKECLALAQTNLGIDIPVAPDVVVRRAGPDDIETFDALKAASFDLPLATARWIDELIFGPVATNVRAHIATIDGRPAGFGQMFLLPEQRIAILGGAGTHPDFRHRGVFRTLLAHRLADARAEGMQAAAIQSYEDTSAPICRRLGFVELGRLRHYTSRA